MAGFGKKVRDQAAEIKRLSGIIDAHEDRLNAFGSLLAQVKKVLESQVLPTLDKTDDDVDYLYTFLGLMEDTDEEEDLASMFPGDDATPQEINDFILALSGGEPTGEPVACGPDGCSS